jgi:CheY-like chemotaxis protein
VRSRSRSWTKLAGKKVLLCEDNELNRQIATALLQKQGMTVVTATDGRQGVDIFSASREHEFAVLLMDVRMPVMDGLMATAAIRALNRRDADVPVVAMTANTFPEDIQACLNVGMNGHVAKPVDPNHLYETLLQVLGE